MKRFIYIIASIACAAHMTCGCNRQDENAPVQNEKVEVSLHAATASTRTAIAEDMLTTVWSRNDKISLWADNSQGVRTLDNETFTLSDAQTSDNGTFTATIAVMPSGQYEYYATYPEAASVSGNIARFDIPEQQNGGYNGSNDILIALPATDKALTQRSCDLRLEFMHAMHALKISIPEGFNPLGERITRMDFTFPCAVTGTMALDITAPQNAPQITGSNTVSVVPEAGTDAAEPALWAFIAPCDVSEGQIQVDLYSEVDHLTFHVAGRDFKAGHITPITMKVPEPEHPRNILRLTMAQNSLGQIPYKVTLTAKDGSTDMGNGSSSLEMDTPNFSTKGYQRIKLSSDADDLSGKEFDVRFESSDAVVYGTLTMPSVTVDGETTVNLDVPPLMSQDFSQLQSYQDIATTGSKSLDGVGLAGWSASRSEGYGGDCINLAPFYALIGRYQGRLDSAPLGLDEQAHRGGIKEGHTVDIHVTFTAGADKIATPLQLGWTTTAGSIDSGTGITNLCNTVTLPKGTMNSPSVYDFDAIGVGTSARLSWRTNVTSGTWTTYSYVPIDNICVTIK